jgi:lipopolysaccharide/colanic/teichoic acid biosynthesis glycosyltransferase
MSGSVFDRTCGAELMQFLRHAVQGWKRPDSTIGRPRRSPAGGWADRSAIVDPSATIVGRAWIGAGRTLGPETTVVGPAVLWDEPLVRPPIEVLEWGEIEPTDILARLQKVRPPAGRRPLTKRAFDIAFALVALALTLPLYPLVMLAIWLEDGRPFFFGHRRETAGGREFSCLKFRSMRKDAERIKLQLVRANQADGPQFFIEDDPRMTRVGKLLRKFNIDELPQFFNVLVGDMSIVGPRPSPRRENQFCPAWREARLSVTPGITGLWQVKRTRRAGEDFQEWIRYDIEYVENAGWKLDLSIIWQTVLSIIRG